VIEPYRIAMLDLWERTTAGMPALWCRRLATDLAEYLHSHHTQALVNSTGYAARGLLPRAQAGRQRRLCRP
jgi:hypothetical protein